MIFCAYQWKPYPANVYTLGIINFFFAFRSFIPCPNIYTRTTPLLAGHPLICHTISKKHQHKFRPIYSLPEKGEGALIVSPLHSDRSPCLLRLLGLHPYPAGAPGSSAAEWEFRRSRQPSSPVAPGSRIRPNCRKKIRRVGEMETSLRLPQKRKKPVTTFAPPPPSPFTSFFLYTFTFFFFFLWQCSSAKTCWIFSFIFFLYFFCYVCYVYIFFILYSVLSHFVFY